MDGMFNIFVSSCILMSMLLTSYAQSQSCSRYAFSSNRVFSSCNDLPYLNSFLHWNFDSSSSRVQIAYRSTAVSPSMWVAWAINPVSTGMVGSQALVAYPNPDGTIMAYTSSVDSYRTPLSQSNLSFPVSDLSATYSNNEMIIYATLELPNVRTTTSVNQVWQNGQLSASTNTPGAHPFSGSNVLSMGTLDLLSGQSDTAPIGNSRTRNRNVSNQNQACSYTLSWFTLLFCFHFVFGSVL